MLGQTTIENFMTSITINLNILWKIFYNLCYCHYKKFRLQIYIGSYFYFAFLAALGSPN